MVLDKVAEEREVGIDQNDLTQHIIRKAQAEGTDAAADRATTCRSTRTTSTST